jgi:transportin-1
LNQFTRAPEYIAYLAYILSSLTQEEDRIRSIAGYLLKNNSRLILSSPPEVANYVKGAVLQAFDDPSIMIRNAASQDIVAFLGVLEPKNWPECLQQLVNALDSPDFDKQEVSHLAIILGLVAHLLLERAGVGTRAKENLVVLCSSFQCHRLPL